MLSVIAQPLDKASFAPFGEVIESPADAGTPMNSGRFVRYPHLAEVDTGGSRVNVGIVRCEAAVTLPHEFDLLERHPGRSQAFLPLGNFPLVIAVAPRGESVVPGDIRAFVSNGRQGINYSPGTWHMPLIGLADNQEFLVIDASDAGCDEMRLDEPLLLDLPS